MPIYFNKNVLVFFFIQFFGAFNDNVYKNLLILIISFRGILLFGLDSSVLVPVCFGLFILPFLTFSTIAGQLADKFAKQILVRYIKLLEVLIMLIAIIGFYVQNYVLLLIVLFLMGAQSALFGPIKFSILPELLLKRNFTQDSIAQHLFKVNGMIEMGTFMAILGGTILAGIMISSEADHLLMISLVLLSIALTGWMLSFFLPELSAAKPQLQLDYSIPAQIKVLLNKAMEDRSVFHVILLISAFWFLGSSILSQLPEWVKTFMHESEMVVTYLFVLYSIGIGAGSLICERIVKIISPGRVVFYSALMVAVNLFVFIISSLFVIQHDILWLLIYPSLFFQGFFAGFYIVPLYTFLQQKVKRQQLARIMSANNVYNAVFMVISALLISFLLVLGVSQIVLMFLFGFFFILFCLLIRKLDSSNPPSERFFLS